MFPKCLRILIFHYFLKMLMPCISCAKHETLFMSLFACLLLSLFNLTRLVVSKIIII